MYAQRLLKKVLSRLGTPPTKSIFKTAETLEIMFNTFGIRGNLYRTVFSKIENISSPTKNCPKTHSSISLICIVWQRRVDKTTVDIKVNNHNTCIVFHIGIVRKIKGRTLRKVLSFYFFVRVTAIFANNCACII